MLLLIIPWRLTVGGHADQWPALGGFVLLVASATDASGTVKGWNLIQGTFSLAFQPHTHAHSHTQSFPVSVTAKACNQ